MDFHWTRCVVTSMTSPDSYCRHCDADSAVENSEGEPICTLCGANVVEPLEDDGNDEYCDDCDDGMDGDAESALASAGLGTDESYGFYEDTLENDFYDDL